MRKIKQQTSFVIFRFDESSAGRRSTLDRYKHEEQSIPEITHKSEDSLGVCYWLKSYGLVSWAIVFNKEKQ